MIKDKWDKEDYGKFEDDIKEACKKSDDLINNLMKQYDKE